MVRAHLTLGERAEKEMIMSFVDRIAELTPQLVTFNGSSFDARDTVPRDDTQHRSA
jgi:predicted PolB exonuclease-like 3'-5' exonuclease